MKRIIMCIFHLINLSAAASLMSYPDELDDIIKFGITNSSFSHNYTNNSMIAKLRHDQIWFSLIPDASLSANYTFQNNMPNTNYSVTIGVSKNFADVDDTVQQFRIAENNYRSSIIDQELDKKEYLDTVIVNYTDLSESIRQKEIHEDEISNDIIIYDIVLSKVKTGTEIPGNLTEYSNEIQLKLNDLELDKFSFSSKIDKFTQITATNPVLYQIKGSEYDGIIDRVKESNQLTLSIDKNKIEISNNTILFYKKNRELFLPTLGISASFGFDFLTGSYNYSYGTSISYPIFEIFKKIDEIKIYQLQNTNINSGILQKTREMRSILNVIEKEIRSLQLKINYLTSEINIEQQLQSEYFNNYQKGKIDLFDFKKRRFELVNDKLDLLHTRTRLYKLNKRLQYGILKLE